MKFLNLDMHISVAEDLNHIFQVLGHTFVRNSLSGHNWVSDLSEPRLKGLNKSNWSAIGPKIVDNFYQKNRKLFDDIDAFVISYPPAFALLFEPFEKPVISVTCTRFDYPTFPNNYGWLIDGLRRMEQNGQLFSIANNLLDKWYNDNILGVPTEHISSLCSYLPQREEGFEAPLPFIPWTRYSHNLQDQFIDSSFSISNKYDRGSIKSHAGVIHLPYNLSIMSAFEHYWQCIPMYFPSESLQIKWLKESPSETLQEVLFPETALRFDADLVRFADWYDPENFAEVRFFDDVDELYEIIRSDDGEAISSNMRKQNALRQEEILSRWSQVISSF